jgi:hypothetical protein
MSSSENNTPVLMVLHVMFVRFALAALALAPFASRGLLKAQAWRLGARIGLGKAKP